MNDIVLNSSPTILLIKAELDFILPKVAGKIFLPEGVLNEIKAFGKDNIGEQIIKKSYINIIRAKIDDGVTAWALGQGESEVISYAIANRTVMPIVDDAKAKACCSSFGLKSGGTGSLLIKAKRGGIISAVRPALNEIRKHGMWISDEVIDIICAAVGE